VSVLRVVALLLVDDNHAVYLWLGRRAADAVNTTADIGVSATETEDQLHSDSSTTNARLTAAKIRAMQTTLAYCTGMLLLHTHTTTTRTTTTHATTTTTTGADSVV